MKKIIVGAGALGRVMYDFVKSDFDVECFLDDSLDYKNIKVCNKLVYTLEKNEVDQFVASRECILAIFSPSSKENLINKLKKIGLIIGGFRSGSSFISDSSKILKGCNILHSAMIMNSSLVGNYVHIHFNSVVGHDVKIGDYSSLGPDVTIGGYSEIGKGVTIGMGAKIIPGISIGDRAIIGAGSVVTRAVEPDAVVAGNPAKNIRNNKPYEI